MARLFPAFASGVAWDLDRTRAALVELGDPHLKYPTLHVGGTNGKGSVAATAAAVLAAAGHRVGLYTSPHLCSFAERILVGGLPLRDLRLQTHADEVRALVERHGLTFFESATLLAFHVFAREGIDIAVLEVGLGGRLDATNVVQPIVTAVTNIALDHADYLGDTLAAIAVEKAGIAKQGVPLLTTERDGELIEVLARSCSDRGASIEIVDAQRISDVRITSDRTEFTLATSWWGELRLTTPLVGGHQADNAALAVAMLEHLPEGLRPNVESVRRGVADVRWPGRSQIVRSDRETLVFDVAHNPAGAHSLSDLLDALALPRPRIGLLGVLADKDWRDMLVPICGRLDRAILSVPESAQTDRRWDPHAAVEALLPLISPGCSLEAIPDFDGALETARAAVGHGTLVITGSVHTVGDAMRRLGMCPFGA